MLRISFTKYSSLWVGHWTLQYHSWLFTLLLNLINTKTKTIIVILTDSSCSIILGEGLWWRSQTMSRDKALYTVFFWIIHRKVSYLKESNSNNFNSYIGLDLSLFAFTISSPLQTHGLFLTVKHRFGGLDNIWFDQLKWIWV